MESGTLRAGDRLPAEQRLAEQFSVSRMTLRAAIEVLQREGWIRRERNVGSFCSTPRTVAGQTSLMSHTVVLLSNHLQPSNDRAFDGLSSSVVSGVMDVVGRLGMNVLSVDATQCSDQWLDDLIASRPAGVILSCWDQRPSIAWQFSTLSRLQSAALPAVTWGDSPALAGFDRIGTDHVSGTEQLTHLLTQQGKRRILRLWTVPAGVPWIDSHNRGYERATTELGLPCLPAVYVEGLTDRNPSSEANFRIRVRQFAGYLAEHLNGPDAIDAIMVGTDCEAFAVLAACRLFGREDVLVTGYDDQWRGLPECQWETGRPFATVDKNNHLLGEEMVRMLRQRINGELPLEPQLRLIEQRVVMTA